MMTPERLAWLVVNLRERLHQVLWHRIGGDVNDPLNHLGEMEAEIRRCWNEIGVLYEQMNETLLEKEIERLWKARDEVLRRAQTVDGAFEKGLSNWIVEPLVEAKHDDT